MSTLIGTGTPGYSDQQVNDPYGLVIGPDGALYFCDLGNQRIRRLDLKTRRSSTIAGSGRKGYAGDQGRAIDAALNMPHEIQFDRAGHLYIAERDNHAIRKVDARTGIISTLAGTGTAGFSGDGGPASQAQLRQPHAIALDPTGRLLICDVGNHRVRRVDLASGRIETYRRHRRTVAHGRRRAAARHAAERAADDGVSRQRLVTSLSARATRFTASPPARPRFTTSPGLANRAMPVTEVRRARPPSAGRKGWPVPTARLYVADTENHAIRRIDLSTGRRDHGAWNGQHAATVPSPTRCGARWHARTACSSTFADASMSATARRTASAWSTSKSR